MMPVIVGCSMHPVIALCGDMSGSAAGQCANSPAPCSPLTARPLLTCNTPEMQEVESRYSAADGPLLAHHNLSHSRVLHVKKGHVERCLQGARAV